MTPEERHAALVDRLTGLVRDIAALHAPDVTRGAHGSVWADCKGCDFSGYDGELPDWPCRTVRLIESEVPE